MAVPIKPKDFCIYGGHYEKKPLWMSGEEIVKIFGFLPAHTQIEVDEADGILHLRDTKSETFFAHFAPEFWALTSDLEAVGIKSSLP